jgi:hypothetical protein
MFEAEARWLRAALDRFTPERLSPLLNLGSSTADFREQVQPWTEEILFRPLSARGIDIVHVDRRDGAGIDIRADLADPLDLPRLRAPRPQALLCCNLLEHVTEPERIARHCLDILPASGLVFVTVPYSYPYHRDPIDTMFRPDIGELAALFPDARLLDGAIIGAGMSYRDEVWRRPWILLRHAARFPAPFVSWEKWKRSMAKLYWLVAEYRIACAVFEKTPPRSMPSGREKLQPDRRDARSRFGMRFAKESPARPATSSAFARQAQRTFALPGIHGLENAGSVCHGGVEIFGGVP